MGFFTDILQKVKVLPDLGKQIYNTSEARITSENVASRLADAKQALRDKAIQKAQPKKLFGDILTTVTPVSDNSISTSYSSTPNITPAQTVKNQFETEKKIYPEKYTTPLNLPLTVPVPTPYTKESERVPLIKNKVRVPIDSKFLPLAVEALNLPGNIVSGLLQMPGNLAKTLYQIPEVIRTGSLPEYNQNTRVMSSWEAGNAIQNTLIKHGTKPETAALVGLLGGGGLGILDTLASGSMTNSAIKMALKGTEGSVAKELAWSKLGKPKTLQEAESNWKNIIREVHPDKLGGSEALSKEANSAITVLREQGLPSKITNITRRLLNTTQMSPTEFAMRGFKLAPKETAPYMNIAGSLPGTAETVPRGQAGFIGEIPTKKVGYASEESNLSNEAKKYKSAEEFVKARTNAYHGTAVDFKTFSKDFIGDNQPADFGRGFYFAKDKASALGYAKEAGGNKVMDVNLDIKNPAKNKDLLAPDVQSAIDDGMGFKDVGEVLKAKGFDGIEYTRADGTVEYTVFDANKIKTKSQLTDIWNKANSPLEQKKSLLTTLRQMKDEHPIRPLLKYVDKRTGELPEVIGKPRATINGQETKINKSDLLSREFSSRGDDIITEYGFTDSEVARSAVFEYRKLTEDIKKLVQERKAIELKNKENRAILKSDKIYNEMSERLVKRQQELIDLNNKYPELSKLIMKLSTEAEKGAIKGYKLGVKVGSKETRAKLIESLREKNTTIESAREQIVQYTKDNLPLSERGKLMTIVRDAKTQEDVVKAFMRIDKKVSELEIKNAITNLKDTVSKMTESNSISADYRNKIKDIISDYELTGHTQKTIDKIQATQNYINHQVSIGINVELPQMMIDKLKILSRIPKEDLTLSQIQGLQNEVELLAKLGETKWASKQALYEAEKEARKTELLNSASAIDSKKIESNPLEKSPSKYSKYIESYIKARNYIQKTRIGLTPIEGLADITGMQPMKNFLDLIFGNYLTYNDDIIKKWYDLTKNFDEVNFIRIGTFAISKQSGGVERLINSGLTPEQIANIDLSLEEKSAYDFARKTFDDEFPAVKKYALDNYNKDVGDVENYVSFMSNNDAMNELEMYDRFGSTPDASMKTKTVEQGFTEKRAEVAKTKLELNIDKIFRRHIDDVAYMLTMGKDIKQYFEIINSPEMRAKLGDVGSVAWLQYLDLMARKGGSEGAKRIAILDTIRKNVAMGVLSFRISSAMVQFTSFADTMATIGSEWAMRGASSIAISKEWRNFVMDNFPEVKKAIGDDLAFREFGDGFMAKVANKGLVPLQTLDGLMRSTAVAGAYQKLALEKGIKIDLLNPDKGLILEATKLMRYSQGSSFFKDQPLSITTNFGLTDNKSLNKTILTFQSFMLARWDNLQRQIWRLGIKNKSYAKAAMSFFWMVLVAAAMEESIRRGVKYGTAKATELVTGNNDKTDYGSFVNNSAMNVIQSIPIFGSLTSSMEYSSNPIPVMKTLEDIIKGSSSVWNGASLRTKLRGAITATGGIGSLAGIPGSSQGSQLLKGMFPTNTSSKSKSVGGVNFNFGGGQMQNIKPIKFNF